MLRDTTVHEAACFCDKNRTLKLQFNCNREFTPVNPRSSEQSGLAGIPTPAPTHDGANLNIRSDCSGLCSVELWVSPRAEVSLSLWVPMAMPDHTHRQKFSCLTTVPLAASSSSLPFATQLRREATSSLCNFSLDYIIVII